MAFHLQALKDSLRSILMAKSIPSAWYTTMAVLCIIHAGHSPKMVGIPLYLRRPEL